MEYISTDDSLDIKHGSLSENPLPGSTARYVCNPIVDDIEALPPGRIRRQRINGRIVIDTTVPDGGTYRYEPPKCLITDGPSVNNLATQRWRGDGLDADAEADLIQRIQDGDERAFRQLLEAFHRTVVGPANNYIPGGTFNRRQKQKHTNDLLYEDLTSVGCFALWQAALTHDRRHRFSTRACLVVSAASASGSVFKTEPSHDLGDCTQTPGAMASR